MDLSNYCMGCMARKGAGRVCPECGWEETRQPESPLQLPPCTILNGHFIVGRVLGQGGFGITYLGWDMKLERKVAIKEYFPNNVAARATDGVTVTAFGEKAERDFSYGLEKFLEEGKTLAKFHEHPGIVSVASFFKANETAYLAMDYVDGITFKEYLEQEGGRISFLLAFKVLMPVMDALRAVHKTGLLHRDISLDNIYLTEQGQVKLLDFGSARAATGEIVKTITVQLKDGYAPEEQYRRRGIQGTWTDVYGMGATFYRAITGQVPPQSLDRFEHDDLAAPSELGIEISAEQEEIMLKALALRAEARFQTIEHFQETLCANVEIPAQEFLVVSCHHCNKKNRIKADRGVDKAKCGSCGAYLDGRHIDKKCSRCETELSADDYNELLGEPLCGRCLDLANGQEKIEQEHFSDSSQVSETMTGAVGGRRIHPLKNFVFLGGLLFFISLFLDFCDSEFMSCRGYSFSLALLQDTFSGNFHWGGVTLLLGGASLLMIMVITIYFFKPTKWLVVLPILGLTSIAFLMIHVGFWALGFWLWVISQTMVYFSFGVKLFAKAD